MQNESTFQYLATILSDKGITAEAVQDSDGEVCQLRLYVDGKAFNVYPKILDNGGLRLAIDEYEATEGETLEEQVERVIEIVDKAE